MFTLLFRVGFLQLACLVYPAGSGGRVPVLHRTKIEGGPSMDPCGLGEPIRCGAASRFRFAVFSVAECLSVRGTLERSMRGEGI